MKDAYRAEPTAGERGYPMGPVSVHSLGPYAPCAIGFCAVCGSNARQTCQVRGLFDCPECFNYWYDNRVGQQNLSFEDFFSGGS